MINDLETALEQAIHDAGGPKEVGHMLRPELRPDAAAIWLDHCLDDDRRDKLSINQIELIFVYAAKKNAHRGFSYFAQRLGFEVKPITPETVVNDLLQRANAVRAELRELEETANNLSNNPRLTALMAKAGVKIYE